jgi:NAD(P)-dependent dehydrogenase (short-subunit alcohol dehydrogenase family)
VVTPVIADYRELDQVRQMCHQIIQDILGEDGCLDVLINNAGVYKDDFDLTKDGFEETYQVNVLASHIVTALLWRRVSERIINVASISASSGVDLEAYYKGKITRETFSGHREYSNSKLFNIMQTLEQAARLHGMTNVTVNCLDPGTVNTKMLLAGWGRIGIPVEEAGDQMYLASSDEIRGMTGQYFVSRRPVRPPSPALDTSMRKNFITMVEEHTGTPLLGT